MIIYSVLVSIIMYFITNLIVLHSSMIQVILEFTLDLSIPSGTKSVPTMFCLDYIHSFRAVKSFVKYLLSDCDIKGLQLQKVYKMLPQQWISYNPKGKYLSLHYMVTILVLLQTYNRLNLLFHFSSFNLFYITF